jgi:iron complex outermembrane recepter protein
LGVEDTLQVVSRVNAVFGFSVDGINVLNAEDFQAGRVLPFPKGDVTSYNPQAGLFYAVSESGKLHFTFARKTRLPSMKDRYSYRMGQAVPNPALREERSNNWEVGYSQLVGPSTYVDVALFWSDISNSTQRFFLQPNLFQFRNIGESRNAGAEFGVRSTVVKSLTLTANYTYLSRKNESNPTLIPVDTPRHKAYGSAGYRLLKRFSAIADLSYEANRWTQNDASRYLRVSPNAVVGIGGTASLYGGAELQAGVSNLFDRNYWIVDGYPESGRSAYVNLRYRF